MNTRTNTSVVALLASFGPATLAGAQCIPSHIGGSGGRCYGVATDGVYVYAAEQDRLTVFDTTDSAHPLPIGTAVASYYQVADVEAGNGFAYVADSVMGVRVLDVRNPRNPFLVTTLGVPSGSAAGGLLLSGNILYAAIGTGGVRIYDVTNPAAPILRSQLSISAGFNGSVRAMVVVGTTLYLARSYAAQSHIDVYDVANPGAPVLRGTMLFQATVQADAAGLVVDGTTVYFANYGTGVNTGLHVIDASNPAAMVEIGSLPGIAGRMQRVGNYLHVGTALVANTPIIQVVDISAPATPALVNTVSLPGSAYPVEFVPSGGAAATASQTGVMMLDVSNPVAPAAIAPAQTPGDAWGVSIVGNLAYVADGVYGLKILDVTVPHIPNPVGQVDTPGTARDVKVAGGIAYVADGSLGLRTIDVSNPTAPVLLGTLDTPGVAEGVFVAGTRAFVADGASGLRIIDITNAGAPVALGAYVYGGVNAAAHDVFVVGTTAYVAYGFYGLLAIDVTNPAAPVLLGSLDTYSHANGVVVIGTTAYVADFSKQLYVINVANPAAPTLIWNEPTPEGSAQRVRVDGTKAFIMASQGGITTYDITTPAAPVLLGRTDSPGIGAGLDVTGGIVYTADGYGGLRNYSANGLPYVIGPSPVTACEGTSAMMTFTSAGGGRGVIGQPGYAAPAYQWRRAGVPIVNVPGHIAGATTPTLTITPVSAADAGLYDCVTSTLLCGSIASPAAALTVLNATDPACGGGGCDSVDFNADGLFPDTTDIDDFLSVFSGGSCSNDPSCGDVDFNNDGLFPDTLDIDSLLSVFSGGPCV